jgi:flagellar protein FliO/FliZ
MATASDAAPQAPATAAGPGARDAVPAIAPGGAARAADSVQAVTERAAPPFGPAGGTDVLTPGSTAQLVASLLVVVALIFALGWLSRRMHRFSPGTRNRALRLVDVLPVGARERIAIIEADGQRLVVGLAPGRVQTLHVLERSPDATGAAASGTTDRSLTAAPAVDSTPSRAAFAGILSRMKS